MNSCPCAFNMELNMERLLYGQRIPKKTDWRKSNFWQNVWRHDAPWKQSAKIILRVLAQKYLKTAPFEEKWINLKWVIIYQYLGRCWGQEASPTIPLAAKNDILYELNAKVLDGSPSKKHSTIGRKVLFLDREDRLGVWLLN